jgi:hypothetical protein
MGEPTSNRPTRTRARSSAPFALALFAAGLIAAPTWAHGRAWNSVEPGTTKREEVVKRFGPATKVVSVEGKEVLAYLEKQAIRGTSQVQFRVDPATGLVDRIDVFPNRVIEKDAIENTYGPACPASAPPAGGCYLKKVTDDFRTYLYYAKSGVAVFLNDDAKTVQSLVFQIPPRSSP